MAATLHQVVGLKMAVLGLMEVDDGHHFNDQIEQHQSVKKALASVAWIYLFSCQYGFLEVKGRKRINFFLLEIELCH